MSADAPAIPAAEAAAAPAATPLHIVVATFHLKEDPELLAEFFDFMRGPHGFQLTRGRKGCRLIEVSTSADQKVMVIYERWATRSDFDEYLKFRIENGLEGLIEKFLSAAPVFQHSTLDSTF
jgi:hypothetical protein